MFSPYDVLAEGDEDIYTMLNDVINLTSTEENKRHQWRSSGYTTIASGKVAVVTMAGGQGSRLGFSGPKGAFNIGLPSKSSLFQLFADRISRVQHLATLHAIEQPAVLADVHPDGIKIPWFIMTSPTNHDATVTFFKQENYFGLDPSQVAFFQQTMLPSFSEAGQVGNVRPNLHYSLHVGDNILYRCAPLFLVENRDETIVT